MTPMIEQLANVLDLVFLSVFFPANIIFAYMEISHYLQQRRLRKEEVKVL